MNWMTILGILQFLDCIAAMITIWASAREMIPRIVLALYLPYVSIRARGVLHHVSELSNNPNADPPNAQFEIP